MSRGILTLACALAGAILLAGCDDNPPPYRPAHHETPAPPQIVAALDEAAGRYLQVTITQRTGQPAEAPMVVRRVSLGLPGQKPIEARELRRGSVAGDDEFARPTIGVDVHGGSSSRVSSGVGVGFPITRPTYRAQVVARIDLPDPALYRRLAGAGIIHVMVEQDGRERDIAVAAPVPLK